LVVCNDARMSSLVGSITFDCARPYELAQFWTEVVGFPIDADSKPDDDEIALEPPPGHPMLLFIRVPEATCRVVRTMPRSGYDIDNRVRSDLRSALATP
jgi:hypothetical protein